MKKKTKSIKSDELNIYITWRDSSGQDTISAKCKTLPWTRLGVLKTNFKYSRYFPFYWVDVEYAGSDGEKSQSMIDLTNSLKYSMERVMQRHSIEFTLADASRFPARSIISEYYKDLLKHFTEKQINNVIKAELIKIWLELADHDED